MEQTLAFFDSNIFCASLYFKQQYDDYTAQNDY